MKCYAFLLLFLLLAILLGCASAPSIHNCVLIGRGGQVCLLAPDALPALHATHIVEIHRNGDEHTFLGQLQIDDHALRLATTSLFGNSLFTVVYDGNTIVSQPPKADLHADMLVVMLELSLATPTALQDRLHNLTFKVSPGDNSQVRELFEHGHLIVRIERSNDPLAEARINITIPADKTSIQMSPIPTNTSQP